MIEIIYNKGDIYKRDKVLYYIPWETYFLETDLKDKNKPIWPYCNKELKIVSEESYFI